jgi:hypothetical protein
LSLAGRYDTKVVGSSDTSARAAPVAASTSITRYTWCPRWLYSKVKPRESAHHCGVVSW